MELSESLLELPAGGQVILSDTTFQRIGGRLHEVKLPSLEVPKPGSYSLDGQPRGKGNRQRNSLNGRSRQQQVRPEGQRSEQSSAANSRRSSMDTIAKLVMMHCSCSSVTNHTQMGLCLRAKPTLKPYTNQHTTHKRSASVMGVILCTGVW